MSEEMSQLLNIKISMPKKVITNVEILELAVPLVQKLVIEGFTLKNIQDNLKKWKTK